MALGIWDLQDEADQLDTAAESWSEVAAKLTGAGTRLDTSSRDVRAAGWEGDTAESYDRHRRKLAADLEVASGVAGDIAAALVASAGSVRVAQGHLDTSFSKVVDIPHTGGQTDLTFQTRTDEERTRVDDAVTEAQQIRDELDRKLVQDARKLRSHSAAWRRISATWLSVANGTSDGFTVPADDDGTGVITLGDRTIISTGAGDDEVTIFRDPVTGEQIVVVNGQVYRFPADQQLTIRGGEGNDTIGVPKGTDVNLSLLGGEGDDVLHGGEGNDHLYGLDGHDYLDAGAGDDDGSGGADRDYLDGQDGDDELGGGLGSDTVYGLEGNDTLTGGEGQDYLEGGDGEDQLHGEGGDDVLSGGGGDDTIHGGSGDDVSYAGGGDDTTYGGSGTDTANSEAGDTDLDAEHTVTVEIKGVPDFIEVDGSPEFVARVRADLEMLAASPRGQQMLAALQHEYDDSGFLGLGKDGLRIEEYPDNSNSDANSDGRIRYAVHLDWLTEDAPPVAVLYHEMAHLYDFRTDNFDGTPYTGTDPADQGVAQGERTAVGLPVDHDHDPSTPEIRDPDHAYHLTENGLREEMGVELRPDY